MSELLKRTIFGLLYVVVFVGTMLLSSSLFALLMTCITMIGTREMCHLFLHENNKKTSILITINTLIFFVVVASTFLQWLPKTYLTITLISFSIPFLIALFSTKFNALQILSAAFSALIFVALPSALMLKILLQTYGTTCLIFIFALISINDVFAYLVGRAIGRHKLFYRISPAKTIEGSVGGLVFTLLTAFLVNHFWLNLFNGVEVLLLALVVVVFGSLGDLCESMLKRQAGVKDSGKVIPGHGGILDRFDAMFFAIPFIYVFLILID